MAKKGSDIASVLAFEKKLVLSDGYLYGTTWEGRHDPEKTIPLKLTEKSVRGTISNRLKETVKNDPAKLNAEVEKPNLQRVDACGLPMECDTLKLEYTIKVLGGVEYPSSCNNATFSQKYGEVARKYIEKTGFKELAARYAVNIVNARTLWRNRLGAEKIEVILTEVKDGGREEDANNTTVWDAYDFSLRDFDNADKVRAISDKIAAALSGKLPYLLFKVETYALIGSGQEVYPSEELVFDKGRGDKSKILYQVDGVAAMHSQKLGNAIRTIDTWYNDYQSNGDNSLFDDNEDKERSHIGPIAIEPYGAVTTMGKAFRTPKNKTDFYSLFDKYALGNPLEREEEEHYVMAVLVRGGVFGQSGKE